MKSLLPRILFIALIGILYFPSNAQVGIGTETPNSKAVLELQSPGNNQGFLVPRLTTAQRTAMTLNATDDKGMLVFDSQDNKFYYWNGTSWTVIEDSVGTGTVTSINTGGGLAGGPITVTGTITIADNGVTTLKIANDAVTSPKIVDGTIATADLANDAVTSAKITDGTIATADLANGSVTATKLANTAVTAGTYGSATQVPQLIIDAQGRVTGVTLVAISGIPPSGAAGGDLTGNYPNPAVATGVITTAKIADGTIVNADIAPAAAIAVTKLGAGTNGQVLTTTGTTPTWANITGLPAMTTGQLVTNNGTAPVAVTVGGDATFNSSGQLTIANNAVTTVKINDGAVTTAKIADGTIANADISTTAAIAVTKLGAGTNGQFLSTSGTTPTWTNISGLPTMTTGQLVTHNGTAPVAVTVGGDATFNSAGQLTIANNAVTTVKINDGAVTTAKIADGTIVNADIAPTAAITVNKLAAGTNGQVLTTTGTTPTWSNITGLPAMTTGQLVTHNGTAPVAVTVGGDATFNAAGQLTIANNAVTTTKINDGAITTAKIADGTIASTDLADGSVTAGKLANTAVVPGSYGTPTVVPRITVDQQGRITAVTNQTISGGANQNLQSVLATGNNAGNSEAVGFSSIGIGTDKPFANLHVEGSHIVSQRVISDSYVIQPTDYSILVTNSAKEMAIRLPPIEGDPMYIGRVLVIRTLNSETVRIIADVDAKDFVDVFGTEYDMARFNNSEDNARFHTLTFIATKLPGGNRWVIVSGLKGPM